MARLFALPLCVAVALPAVSCDREKAEQVVAEAKARAAAAHDESTLMAEAHRLVRAVDARDLEALRQLCTLDTASEYGRILNRYYHAFAAEHQHGTDAARAYLAGENARPDLSSSEREALDTLDRYFAANGTVVARELLGLIIVIAFEAKYPGYGGKVANEIIRRLNLVDLDRPQAP